MEDREKLICETVGDVLNKIGYYKKRFKHTEEINALIRLINELESENSKFKGFMERNDWENVEHIETTLDKCQEVLYERLQQAGKEKAEKIFGYLTEALQYNRKYGSNFVVLHPADIKEIARQCGIKIKEI